MNKKLRIKIKKILTKTTKVIGKAGESADKHLLKKAKYRAPKGQQATVVVEDKEVADYLTDKRRFFKDKIEEDRRQLYFS